MFQRFALLFSLILGPASAIATPVLIGQYPAAQAQPVITIIMDDMGMHKERSQRALRLPGALTYAFLPHTRHGQALANIAHKLDKEIILHLPMQPVDDRRLDPGVLTPAQSKQQFLAILKDNLQRIPHIRGVNNHMGSLLTQQTQPMTWLMQELARHGDLFFIDSRTSPHSIGYQQAKQHGLQSLRRNIFLDNDVNIAAINRQFMQLIAIARAQGSAIAIAHPYPETLAYLEGMLPALPLLGIRLLPASQLIQRQNPPTRPMTAPLQTAELKALPIPSKTSPEPPNLVR